MAGAYHGETVKIVSYEESKKLIENGAAKIAAPWFGTTEFCLFCGCDFHECNSHGCGHYEGGIAVEILPPPSK